jgi:hypothetical protein
MNTGNISNSNIPIPQPRGNSSQLNSLKRLVKVLYDDISFEIINYICKLKQPADEWKLAEDLNLSYTQVRQSLILMEKHGLLLSQEHKRKRNDDEEDAIILGNIGMGNLMKNTNLSKNNMNIRRNKTSDWKLNDTYYFRIKSRFSELKTKLEKTLKEREKLKFECSNPKCTKKIYEVSEAARKEYICTVCEGRYELIEQKPEDVTLLRKKCNEVLSILQESFFQSDKSAPDYQSMQTKQKPVSTKERKTVNNLSMFLQNSDNNYSARQIDDMKNQLEANGFLIAESLEEPQIDEFLESTKKEGEKLKKFKEIVEFYAPKYS